jgi:hypothetical protein
MPHATLRQAQGPTAVGELVEPTSCGGAALRQAQGPTAVGELVEPTSRRGTGNRGERASRGDAEGTGYALPEKNFLTKKERVYDH